jgi:predicted CopG family antitoxin
MVKTITIRDEIYQKLIQIKREDESFSQLFDRLTECRDSRQALIQLRGSVQLTDEETKQILAEIREKRAERRI